MKISRVNKLKKQKQAAKKQQAATATFTSKHMFMLAGIVMLVFICYSPSLNKEFINHDDNWYIYENPYLNPFSADQLSQIFSHFYSGQYSPLPMAFIGVVRQIAGNETFLYKFMAVLLHAINVCLVCFLLYRITKKPATALIVSVLFGICTMNVESIAWASAAFKTGFYSAFFLSSLIAYTYYVITNRIKYIVFALVFFVLSFLSKEQAVALVLSMICIDFVLKRNLLSKKVVLEKIPFFVLSLAFGIITMNAAASNRDTLSYSNFSILERALFACYSLGEYVIRIFVPHHLSAYYPYPDLSNFSPWIYFYPLLVTAIIFIFFRTLKKEKLTAFGILFFFANILFTLALQFVSVREIVMADRYVYISSIGLFVAFASQLNIVAEKYARHKQTIYGLLLIYIIATSVLTFNRTKIWKDTMSVMENSLENYEAPLPLVSIGVEYMQKGNLLKAAENFNRTIELFPDYGMAYLNRGTIYANNNQDSLALADYNNAVRLKVNAANLFANRGGLYIRAGKYDLALADFEHAIKLKPNFAPVYYNRAIVYSMQENYEAAIADYTTCIRLNPRDAKIYFSRAKLYLRLNQVENARADILLAKQLGLTIDAGYLQQVGLPVN